MASTDIGTALNTAQVISFRRLDAQFDTPTVAVLQAIRTRLQLVETLIEDCGRDLALLEGHREFDGLVSLSIELSRLCARLG